MLPKTHIILGGISTIIIYFIFPLSFLQLSIIFLSTFLIDVDHYLFYVFCSKDLSLRKAYLWFTVRRKKWKSLKKEIRKNSPKDIYIFHSIEFIIVLIALSYLNIIFLYVLIGVLIHLFFDYVELIYIQNSLYGKFSQIHVYLRNNFKNLPNH